MKLNSAIEAEQVEKTADKGRWTTISIEERSVQRVKLGASASRFLSVSIFIVTESALPLCGFSEPTLHLQPQTLTRQSGENPDPATRRQIAHRRRAQAMKAGKRACLHSPRR